MADRFTESTRKLVELAKASVLRYKHTHITPEHMLLALIELNDESCNMAFGTGKATPPQIKVLVEHHLRPGEYSVSAEELNFSERSKRVIEAAKEESVRGQQAQIGPFHLLLGLVRVRNTVASAVLAAIDLNPDTIRDTVKPV